MAKYYLKTTITGIANRPRGGGYTSALQSGL